MNSKQVWFLYKQGLINSLLIGSLAESCDIHVENLVGMMRRNMVIASLMPLVLCCLTSFVVTAVFMGDKFGWSLWFIGGGCSLWSFVLSLIYAVNHCAWITKRLVRLNNLLFVYMKYEGYGKYYLEKDRSLLSNNAKSILSKLARHLVSDEMTYGVNDPRTNKSRKSFKEAHETFVAFDLCEESQGVYIREAQKNK